MLVLDQSMLQCFKSCPRKYYWQFIRNLRSKRFSPALSFGSLAHKFVDDLYLGVTQLEDTIKEYERNLEVTSPLDVFESDKVRENFEYIKTMARAYQVGYNEQYKDDLQLYEVIGKEVKLTSYLTPNFVLFGKLDAILKSKSDSKLTLMETKTTSSLGAAYLERLALDTQITTYVYLMSKHSNLGLPDIILYDIIRKTKAKRREQDTWQSFYDRLLINMEMDPKEYFYREHLIRDDTVLKDFEAQMINLFDVIQTLSNLNVESAWWQNTQACSSYEGCEYFKLCSLGEQNSIIFYTEAEPYVDSRSGSVDQDQGNAPK